jgi:hypothetical protein
MKILAWPLAWGVGGTLAQTPEVAAIMAKVGAGQRAIDRTCCRRLLVLPDRK